MHLGRPGELTRSREARIFRAELRRFFIFLSAKAQRQPLHECGPTARLVEYTAFFLLFLSRRCAAFAAMRSDSAATQRCAALVFRSLFDGCPTEFVYSQAFAVQALPSR